MVSLQEPLAILEFVQPTIGRPAAPDDYGDGIWITLPTGRSAQIAWSPWPACVGNEFCGWAGRLASVAPIAQWHVTTGTLLMYLSVSKLKHCAYWFPRLRLAEQICGGAASSGRCGTQLV